MGLDLQQMRDSLRRQLGVDIADLTDPQADLLLNRSFWNLADREKFREKEKETIFSTVAGTRSYDINSVIGITSYEGIQLLSYYDTDIERWVNILPMKLTDYQENRLENVEQRDKPQYYIRRDNDIILFPTPDAIYDITVFHWVTLADLVSGGPPIPQSWHEVILYGAVARGHEELTSDLDRADRFLNRAEGIIDVLTPTQAKEKYDWHKAQLRAVRPAYRV